MDGRAERVKKEVSRNLDIYFLIALDFDFFCVYLVFLCCYVIVLLS